MEGGGERRLHSTTVRDRDGDGSATFIVTDRRLIIRWQGGDMEQILLTHIGEVWSGKDVTAKFRSVFRQVPYVYIKLANGNGHRYTCASLDDAKRLSSKIQDAMIDSLS